MRSPRLHFARCKLHLASARTLKPGTATELQRTLTGRGELGPPPANVVSPRSHSLSPRPSRRLQIRLARSSLSAVLESCAQVCLSCCCCCCCCRRRRCRAGALSLRARSQQAHWRRLDNNFIALDTDCGRPVSSARPAVAQSRPRPRERQGSRARALARARSQRLMVEPLDFGGRHPVLQNALSRSP